MGNVVGDVQSTQGGERRLRAQERDVWDTRRIQDSKLASGVCVLRNINKRSCAKPITRISQLSAKATSGSYMLLRFDTFPKLTPCEGARFPNWEMSSGMCNRLKEAKEISVCQERDIWDTSRIQDSKLAGGVRALRNINK